MTEERVEKQQAGKIQPANLQEAVQVLRTCFSTVRVKTWLAEDGTAIGVRLQGSEDDLGVRRLVAYNLARCLPPALSVIGIKPETEAEIQHEVNTSLDNRNQQQVV